jgi:hypothetical protein
MFKDSKRVIRICKSKERQYNDQNKKDRKKNLQNTTQKTKDRVTRTPLKTGDERVCSGRVSSSCSTNDTCCVTLVINPAILHFLLKWLHQTRKVSGHVYVLLGIIILAQFLYDYILLNTNINHGFSCDNSIFLNNPLYRKYPALQPYQLLTAPILSTHGLPTMITNNPIL